MAPRHRNLSRTSNLQRNTVVHWLVGVALAALLPSVAAAALPPLVKTYPIGFGRNATLTSSVDCGILRCSIYNTLFSDPVDRLVMLTWRDAQGEPLVSAVNSYFGNLWAPELRPGYLEATRQQTEFTREFAIQQDLGTADFTGTTPGNTPCSLANGGYICSGPEGASYYHFPPSVWSTPTGGGAPPAPGTGTEIGRVTTRFSTVGIDPETMTVPDDQQFTFLEFVSTVSIDNGAYLYAHEVINHTELDIPVIWAAAGIDGIVNATSTTRVELLSPLAPATYRSVTEYRLEKEEFGIAFEDNQTVGAMIFAPVPEPTTVGMVGAGLAVLLWQRRRRTRVN